MAIGGLSGALGAYQAQQLPQSRPVVNPGESTYVTPGRKSSPADCETCQNRKYKDGSDENDVSFQTPGHIDPRASASRVRAHEQEHVMNAFEKAAEGGGKVLQASVTMKTAICPECGRSFIAGGLTTTRIAYPNGDQPYMKGLKSSHEANGAVGSNLDLSA